MAESCCRPALAQAQAQLWPSQWFGCTRLACQAAEAYLDGSRTEAGHDRPHVETPDHNCIPGHSALFRIIPEGVRICVDASNLI